MSKSKIWITGSKGSLGSTIASMIDRDEYDLLLSDTDVDITDNDTVVSYIEIGRPDVVINCAGISDVYECEENPVLAYKVNTLGAGNIAAASRKIGAKMIQISTDDVFSGKEMVALTEFDSTLPATVYGKSKLAGENYVREMNPKHLIIRSSWVYGGGGKNDFVANILKQSNMSSLMYVPNDQISSPTSSSELAKFIIEVMESGEYGIYHASCEGSCTRYEFAKTILEMSGIEGIEVQPSLTQKGDGNPRFTLLRNMMMEITEMYKMPHWKDALREYLDNYNV